MDQKCLSCKQPHPSVCRPTFTCDRCHRRDAAAPEILELLRRLQSLHTRKDEVQPAEWDAPFSDLTALLKRIDGDQP